MNTNIKLTHTYTISFISDGIKGPIEIQKAVLFPQYHHKTIKVEYAFKMLIRQVIPQTKLIIMYNTDTKHVEHVETERRYI